MIKTIKTLIAVAALSGTVSANVQAAEVKVDKGDTLWELSQVHNASVDNIKKWNKLSTDLIHPGDVLSISSEKQYLVKDGDTLWDIAKEYKISIDQLKIWNKLTTDLIKPGLKLVIYENNSSVEVGTLKPTKVKASKATVSNRSVIKPTLPTVKKKNQPVKRITKAKPKAAPAQKVSKKVINVKATAYTASCKGCSGVTRTGVNLKANPNAKVISVDPAVIPLGSKVFVEGYGYATAADTGGSIKGNRIDVFVPSKGKAMNWGSKQIKVTIIN
ncbi:LysM peptidoglycan-binding domain-containing protein [Neobacillus sp. PS3-40]|uniref:LysM peptidoglycan-binding and 3D domain-containing protein n=1 Tax=Neobacillus sp. PS3-40 TaxID=3070679 RepID=UPI0027DFF613|nr:LysM peptidoglycan-binding domain-containing protein [Neobacillus sp. PS3-40]WML44912.1 LysM peptidoglycan-binding domain-containing protein [Neobacillus sp. PS3-40]